MIKYKNDGTPYYYYYKKKVGRRKKRGRKKERVKKIRTQNKQYMFKIIKCTFNKQKGYIGKYHDLSEVEEAKRKLELKNSQIQIPVRYVNSSRLEDDRYSATEYLSEYVVLKRILPEEANEIVKLRDEYGRFVEHETNSSEWKIYDKFQCLKEETFWVYGYNPQSDRKPFDWIYTNMISDELLYDPSVVIQCVVYKNKLVLKYDSIRIGLVICKNESDSIRLYNKLKDAVRIKKIKHVYFMGAVTSFEETGKYIINQIAGLTGWSLQKIRQKST